MIKNKLRKISTLVLALVILVSTSLYAASLTGSSSVKVGDTFTLTFDFGTNVGAYDNLKVSYDTSMFEYVSGDLITEEVWWDQSVESKGISTKTYTFKALKEGSSRITVVTNGTISANEAMDNLGTVTAEKMVNTYVPKDDTKEDQPVVTPPSNNNNTSNNTNTSSQTLNSNNYLKYLQISEEGLTPNFTRNVTDYSIAVGENVNSIQVLARAEDSNARVEITGHESISEGDNKIQIKVTAQNGYYRIYTITVTKTKDKDKSNAYLENLIIENFNLDKAFQSEVLEYSIGEVLSTQEAINVVATTKDVDAKIEIIGANTLAKVGEGEIIVKVIAPDGVTEKQYKIKYTVKEATVEEAAEQEMKEYLKDIKSNQSNKDVAIAYIKYIWAAIKKNYLLVLMYLLILIELINIIVLRRKVKKLTSNEEDNGPDDTPPAEKEILKVEIKEEEKQPEPNTFESTQNTENMQTMQIPLLDEKSVDEPEVQRIGRRGSLEKNTSRADGIEEEPKSEGIKLVDLSKNDGPQDELTFNIFENLTDEDIKRMLEDQIDKD
ncbi:MAG: cadherin-like beta sandwich domain-containing protein [Clostridia bacterium]|nr:cadherin-like beta sandwich domain-containing protein [Clostridia bacterium]